MLVILTTTNPTLLYNANSKRKKVAIQMQPSSIDANNTGRVHIAVGFQPNTTVGDAMQGEALLQGASIEQPRAGEPISERWKGPIWATASATNQSLVIEEEIEM